MKEPEQGEKTAMPYTTIKFSDSKGGDTSHHTIGNFNLLVQSIREIIGLQSTHITACILYTISKTLQDKKKHISHR